MNDDEESQHLEGYTDEEWHDIMEKIMKREITLCKTCDTFFEYSPQKLFCDECSVKRRRGYYQKNKEKYREYNHEYYLKNKEKIREYERRPEVKEKKREYYQKNKKKLREYQREYQQRPENKEKKREYQREYFLRKKAEREEE